MKIKSDNLCQGLSTIHGERGGSYYIVLDQVNSWNLHFPIHRMRMILYTAYSTGHLGKSSNLLEVSRLLTMQL